MAGKNEYTVFDYLQWRGDLTLQQDPFNEVDNLVLCIIAYINLRKIDRIWRRCRHRPVPRSTLRR